MKAGINQIQSYVPEEPVQRVKSKYHLKRLARLSANENPYGTSPLVKEALINAINDGALNRYPDGDASELRALVGQQLNVAGDQLVFGVGLDEIIELVARAFLTPDDQVVVAKPAFSEYALHATVEGAAVKEVPVNPATGHFDFAGALAVINEATRLVWICNPNNPTGVLESPQAIEDFVRQVPKDTLVFIDEAYLDFADDPAKATCLPLVKRYQNVAVLRTLSKAYGLANVRVGFAVMPVALAAILQKIRLPYNLNTMAQVAAVAALRDQDFVKEAAAKNAVERAKWEDFFDQQGVKYFKSQANFIYFTVKNAADLAQALLEKGFQVRRHLQPDWLRLTIGPAEDTHRHAGPGGRLAQATSIIWRRRAVFAILEADFTEESRHSAWI